MKNDGPTGPMTPERLRAILIDLYGWMDYVLLGLTFEGLHENGKLRLLEELFSKDDLTKLRDEVRSARYRLLNMYENVRVPPPSEMK